MGEVAEWWGCGQRRAPPTPRWATLPSGAPSSGSGGGARPSPRTRDLGAGPGRGARADSREDPDESQPRDVAHAVLGDAVGGLAGRDALGLGAVEDVAERAVDGLDLGLGPLGRVALELVGHVDEAAGVDHVVGGVQDAELPQGVAVLVA